MVFRALSLAIVLSAVGVNSLVIGHNVTQGLERRYSNSAIPSGWSYAGCFTDTVSNRLLPAQYQNIGGQSPQQCIGWCGGMGYPIAGLEYGAECFCDKSYAYTPQQDSDADCNMKCSGDAAQTCGAGNRLQIYTTKGSTQQAGAEHYITIVNGCKTRTVQPTMALTDGAYNGASSVTLNPGDVTVFKLVGSANAWTGTIFDGMSAAVDSGSRMLFHFDGATMGSVANGWYYLNNGGGFTVPQVAVSWPSTSDCATKRCYTNSCDNTQALGSDISASAKALVTSSCSEQNQGITLYYCSAQ